MPFFLWWAVLGFLPGIELPGMPLFFLVVGSAGISSRDGSAWYAVVFFVVGSAGISSRDRAARYAVVFLARGQVRFRGGP